MKERALCMTYTNNNNDEGNDDEETVNVMKITYRYVDNLSLPLSIYLYVHTVWVCVGMRTAHTYVCINNDNYDDKNISTFWHSNRESVCGYIEAKRSETHTQINVYSATNISYVVSTSFASSIWGQKNSSSGGSSSSKSICLIVRLCFSSFFSI